VNRSKNIAPVYHDVRRKNSTFRMSAFAQLPKLQIGCGLLPSEFARKVNVVAAKQCPSCVGIESLAAFRLFVVLESSILHAYSFSPKDHLRRHRRAPPGPNHACKKGLAKQMSCRAQSRTSWMLICPSLGGRRRMAGTSVIQAREENDIALRDVRKEEQRYSVTLETTAECRARICGGRASIIVTPFEQGIQGSATTCSK
jgi:hypothetical protein